MPTKILLIENDAALASTLTDALEAEGFEVRATGDGKEGLDLAREWEPRAVVLCVELPGMSGYLVCQRLKKDDALKAIPLVLTSAEATEETFEKHRALKVRADEYLFKPYAPEALVDAVLRVAGAPDPAPEDDDIPRPQDDDLGEEELVSLEDAMGLEALPNEPVEDLPALDLSALPDEPVESARGARAGLDDELRLLDDAFEELAHPSAGAGDDGEALELELGLAPPDEGEPFRLDDDVPPPAAGALADDRAADLGLDALSDESDSLPLPPDDGDVLPFPSRDRALSSPEDGAPRPATRRAPVRGASADLLRAAGIPLLDDDLPAPEPSGSAARAAAGRLERELEDARARTADAESALAGAREKIDALSAQARRAEGEAAEARRRAADAERRAELAESEARRKGEEAAKASGAIARAEALERELEALRTDLVVARGEAEGARGEVEKRTVELRRRVQELEAGNAKNEERVLRAYQKIKGDEKVRDKVRKALAIAAQLLEEGAAAETGPKDPRAAATARE